MSNRIIKINPIHKLYSITWMLGSFCNYNCSYCPPELHDSTSKPHSLETLKGAWNNVYNKTKHLNLKYKVSFTGGEVTANKAFLPFINWLRHEYSEVEMILITTNGSASLNYYSRLSAVVESISFSTHSEFMDEDSFFDKAIKLNQLMVRPRKSFHVNVMDEPWNQEAILRYKELLNSNNISYSVNKIC